MSGVNVTNRRRLAELLSEERRVAFLRASKSSEAWNALSQYSCDQDPAEFVQVSGRHPNKKHAAKLCGAFHRVEEVDEASVLYCKTSRVTIDELGGAVDHGEDEGSVYLARVKRGSKKVAWRFLASPGDTRKGFAFNEDGDVRCPTAVGGPWHCYDGKELGYQVDAELTVVEIPLGFCPVETPREELSTTIKDGAAQDTIVKVVTEPDESQVRRLSPRAWIILPERLGGYACRGRAELMRAPTRKLSDEDREALWVTYQECKKRWQEYVDSTYYFFVATTPTVWYRRVEDLPVPVVGFIVSRRSGNTGRGLTGVCTDGARTPAAEAEAEAEAEAQAQVEADAEAEAQATAQNEAASQTEGPKLKRARVDTRTIGDEQDPFLKCVSRASMPAEPSEGDRSGGGGGGSGGHRAPQPERSNVEVDYRALRRMDAKARTRVLAEATQRHWYAPLVVDGLVDERTIDADLDEIWVWMVAVLQEGGNDIDTATVLAELARATVRASDERVRATLARLLSICDAVPPGMGVQHPEDQGAVAIAVFVVAIEILGCDAIGSSSFVDSEAEKEVGVRGGEDTTLAQIWLLAQMGFDARVARKLFDPRRRPPKSHTFWSPLLVAAAFGVVLSTRVVVNVAFTSLIAKLRQRICGTQSGTPPLAQTPWRQLVSLYWGVAWHTSERAALVIDDIVAFAAAVPEAYSEGLEEAVVRARTAIENPRLRRRVAVSGANDAEASQASQPSQQWESSQSVEGSQVETTAPPLQRSLAVESGIEPAEEVANANMSHVISETVEEIHVDDVEKDPSLFASLAAKALDRVMARFPSIVPAEASVGEREHARQRYEELCPPLPGLPPSARIENALLVAAADSSGGAALASWPFFHCAEILRNAVSGPRLPLGSEEKSTAEISAEVVAELGTPEALKERKNNLLRACKIYSVNLALPNQSEVVKAAAFVRRAQVFELLDELDDNVRGNSEGRAMKIIADHRDCRGILKGMTLRRWSMELCNLWGMTKSNDNSVGTTTVTNSPPRLQQPQEPDPAVSMPPQADRQPTEPFPAPPTSSITRTTLPENTSLPPRQQAALATAGLAGTERGVTVGGGVSAPGTTATQTIGPTESSVRSNAPRVRTLTLADLLPDVRLPWVVNARVQSKSHFQTGTGFQVLLSDGTGLSMSAFFFRQVARQFDSAVRPGVRLRIVAPTDATVVRKADPRYGSGLQLVIGHDAEVDAETFRLGRLPPPGSAVEVTAYVVNVRAVEIAANGQPFRKVQLADETTGRDGLLWYAFGKNALDIPEVLPAGTVLRVDGTVVKHVGRNMALSSGRAAKIWPAGGGDRADELRAWAHLHCRR